MLMSPQWSISSYSCSRLQSGAVYLGDPITCFPSSGLTLNIANKPPPPTASSAAKLFSGIKYGRGIISRFWVKKRGGERLAACFISFPRRARERAGGCGDTGVPWPRGRACSWGSLAAGDASREPQAGPLAAQGHEPCQAVYVKTR